MKTVTACTGIPNRNSQGMHQLFTPNQTYLLHSNVKQVLKSWNKQENDVNYDDHVIHNLQTEYQWDRDPAWYTAAPKPFSRQFSTALKHFIQGLLTFKTMKFAQHLMAAQQFSSNIYRSYFNAPFALSAKCTQYLLVQYV